MNVMQIAFTKAVLTKAGKTTKKSGTEISKALKNIYSKAIG